jgi:hypothetical protein
VQRLLAEHGIEPAPERGRRMPWRTFLRAHWDAITAADFFTVEVLGWCLNHLVLLSEAQLRGAVSEYVEPYHGERRRVRWSAACGWAACSSPTTATRPDSVELIVVRPTPARCGCPTR